MMTFLVFREKEMSEKKVIMTFEGIDWSIECVPSRVLFLGNTSLVELDVFHGNACSPHHA
jgi:hypothetical protein